jgi:iron-sulfur cluster assembly enzyme ISCU, mitochondrial
VHCSMLAEDAIKSAIRDYKSKRQNMAPTLGPEAIEAATSIGSAVATPIV